jgi:N-acetylglucosamine malate deacetylase 1
MFKNKNILVLSPHTDDETLGCGGFINKLSKDNDIFFICFSYCDKEELKDEYRNAIKVLCDGVEPYYEILDFKVRYFDRQEVLDTLIKIKRQINPDVILCNSGYDIHQDHLTVHNESIRAFKDKTILGYCHHWNVIGKSDLRLLIDLDGDNVNSKKNAMDQYKSQSNREYFIHRDWVTKQEKMEVILWRY